MQIESTILSIRSQLFKFIILFVAVAWILWISKSAKHVQVSCKLNAYKEYQNRKKK